MPVAQAERSAASRAAILTAATEAFAERGFHATTTRDIAAAAGLSPAAMYVHHSSKEELLWLISESGHSSTVELIRAAVARGSGPREQLANVVRAMSYDHAERHVTARVIHYELDALSPEHRIDIDAKRREIITTLRKLVERGICTGDFATTEADLAANSILSLIVDVGRWYRDDGRWTPAIIADFNAEASLRIVGASCEPERSSSHAN